MPFIRIQLIEGRTKNQKAQVAKEISNIVQKTLDVPLEKIHIIFEEMKKENYAPYGDLLDKD